jgi:hypothetical protein
MTMEQIKADLLYKASLDAVAKGERDAKMSAGMKDVPVNKMMSAIQYLEKNLLPAVKKRGGGESADYKFFSELIDYMIWAIVIADRYDSLEGRWVRQKIDIALLREWLEFYEKQLSKYTSMEDLLLTSGLDEIAKGVKQRATDLLKNKK